MSKYLGDFEEDSVIPVYFTSNDKDGGSVAPSAAFELADFKIYKTAPNGTRTTKSATDGLTIVSPYDSESGLHLLEMDSSDDTNDAGFWTTGSSYAVMLIPSATVDGETIKELIGYFTIAKNAHIIWDARVTDHTISSTFGKKHDITGVIASETWVTAAIQDALFATGIAKSHKNTYYVDPTGDDGSGDGSEGLPWATITHALTQIVDGDKVIVNDGTYSERIVANAVYETGVVIEAANRHGAILTNSSNNYCWEFDGGSASKGWTLRGFQMKPADGTGSSGSWIRFDRDIENCIVDQCKFIPPDDAQSTANGLTNSGSNSVMRNVVFTNCEGDLESEMGLARFTNDVADVAFYGNNFTNFTSGIDIDDIGGSFWIENNTLNGSGTAIWIRPSSDTGGHENGEVTVRNNRMALSAGYGFRFNGVADWLPAIYVEGNSIIHSGVASSDIGIAINEWTVGGKVCRNSVVMDSSNPAVAVAADGSTGYVGRFEIQDNYIINRASNGHGLINGYMGEGASIKRNTIYGGDEGVVLKGQNISFENNHCESGSGAAVLVKGGTDIWIANNFLRTDGDSGDRYCLDIREQDAGTYAQRDANRLRIYGNKLVASGTIAIAFRIDALGTGDNIWEDDNEVLVLDGATAADIKGNTVNVTEEWNQAYVTAGYAEPHNGLHTRVNQSKGLSQEEVQQIRWRLGLDGTVDFSSTDSNLSNINVSSMETSVYDGIANAHFSKSFSTIDGNGSSDDYGRFISQALTRPGPYAIATSANATVGSVFGDIEDMEREDLPIYSLINDGSGNMDLTLDITINEWDQPAYIRTNLNHTNSGTYTVSVQQEDDTYKQIASIASLDFGWFTWALPFDCVNSSGNTVRLRFELTGGDADESINMDVLHVILASGARVNKTQVQASVQNAIEANHLDHEIIAQGAGAGSGASGFTITTMPAGISTGDLVGCKVQHVNTGQTRRIVTATITGSTLNATVSEDWNNVPGLGATFIIYADEGPTVESIRQEIDDNSSALALLLTRLPGVVQPQSGDAFQRLLDYRLGELIAAALTADPQAGSLYGDLTEDNAGTQRFTADALSEAPAASVNAQDIRDAMKLAPSAGAPAAGSVDEHLDDILEATTGGSSGSGAHLVTVTVDDGTDPIEGAWVRMYLDVANNFVLQTDASGQATFSLDSGTYQVGITKAGYSFTPENAVIAGAAALPYSMTVNVITPSDPGFTTVYSVVYDETGQVEEGVNIYCQAVSSDVVGVVLDETVRTAVSQANGLVQFPNTIKGVVYRFWRETSAKRYNHEVPLTTGDDFELPSIVGN